MGVEVFAEVLSDGSDSEELCASVEAEEGPLDDTAAVAQVRVVDSVLPPLGEAKHDMAKTRGTKQSGTGKLRGAIGRPS